MPGILCVRIQPRRNTVEKISRTSAAGGLEKLIVVRDPWTKEREFNGLLEEAQKGLLFLLLTSDANAFMAAYRAQLERFATPALKIVDTIVAHDFSAMGALVSRFDMPMSWAKQRAIGQNDGRGRTLNLEFGNGDGDICVLYYQLDIANAEFLSRHQDYFRCDLFLP